MNGVTWRDPTYDFVIWVSTVSTFIGVFVIVWMKAWPWIDQADKTARPSEVNAKVRG